MKKTNFWKGLALAAVALVGVYTTSCSEEELKIQGGTIEVPELAEPVANLAITVLDFENSEVLKYEVKNINDQIGKEFSFPCPEIPGYTVAEAVKINVPAIGKGQAIVIPVTFYVVPLGSEIEKIVNAMGGELPVDPNAVSIIENPEVSAKGGLPIDEKGIITNDTDFEVEVEISIPYKSGFEYREESSRSVVPTLKSLKADTKIYKEKIKVSPRTRVEIKATQEKTPVILTIEDTDYNLWQYELLNVNKTHQSLSHGGHDNDHDNSHDNTHDNTNDNDTDGGGIVEAE